MDTVCNVQGCGRLADGSRGWCQAHYMRWWYTKKEPTGPVAPRHREQGVCAVEGCDRGTRGPTYCGAHYIRNLRNGHPGPAEIQKKAGNGKGSGRYISNGYVFVRADHANAYRNGVVMEHRLVMSGIVGRPLLPEETVHHRNGDTTDNRPQNLELWSSRHQKGQRVADKLAWAKEIIDLYGDLPRGVAD